MNGQRRPVIAVLLLAAAALDLSRCGVALTAARRDDPTAGLVLAGIAAAALSLGTAQAFQLARRWPAWVALFIGLASGPQAAATGFHAPYTIPDAATAALGVLLAVAVLATAGRPRLAGPSLADSCTGGDHQLAEPPRLGHRPGPGPLGLGHRPRPDPPGLGHRQLPDPSGFGRPRPSELPPGRHQPADPPELDRPQRWV
ncbi:MAG: US12 family protein [Actinobacteria bacterium]|nr:US12 family protein [Actinomycetota bacterium]